MVRSEESKISHVPVSDRSQDEISADFNLDLENEWADFKLKYRRAYNSAGDEKVRRSIFENNLKKIKSHNVLYKKGIKKYSMRVNEFADMTFEEFAAKKTCFKRRPNNPSDPIPPATTYLTSLSPLMDLPDHVNWTEKGYVTPVKSQGSNCGSCYAFSTTGSIEGQHFRKTGKLVSLSEQQLVDCSSKYGNEGCNGGLMNQSMVYVQENGGIDTEESYPYVGQDQQCKFNEKTIGATVSGLVQLPYGDEEKLKEAVATVGPISVGMDAGHDSFMFYFGGIFDEPKCSSVNLNHGVLLVGYGTLEGVDYWLVKNSWGTFWGDEGYVYMSRGKKNQCGIASAASYPLV
ncbi:hypothetical protein HELRODRAFT_185843 [Helobdella robusta]|uniref:Cathepsin L n=1 Tax=Helobdella robusta TaxID=6412 RepID=T1FNC9_HELRO|nr:hypothetical protein HELRODRAFT_185843 [Helobdella robusta]ESN98564.1 hypothetical protein HELRODRAFT_185843 [Helobdella robusta]